MNVVRLHEAARCSAFVMGVLDRRDFVNIGRRHGRLPLFLFDMIVIIGSADGPRKARPKHQWFCHDVVLVIVVKR